MAAIPHQLHMHCYYLDADIAVFKLLFPWLFMGDRLDIYIKNTRIRIIYRFFCTNDFYRFLPKPIAFSIFLRVFEAIA